MHGTVATKKKAIQMLRQSHGTVATVIDMVCNDNYCIDVIQQIDSTIGMLKTARYLLLEGHLNGCLDTKLKADKQKTIQELLKVFRRADNA
jgi:DNA-binding FrmR family transcriptional regulator